MGGKEEKGEITQSFGNAKSGVEREADMNKIYRDSAYGEGRHTARRPRMESNGLGLTSETIFILI